SPNAGWPESAMAGALGLALAGPRRNPAGLLARPGLCDSSALAGASAIFRGVHLSRIRCLTHGGLFLRASLVPHDTSRGQWRAERHGLGCGGGAGGLSCCQERRGVEPVLQMIGQRIEGGLDLLLVRGSAGLPTQCRDKRSPEGVARKQPVEIATGHLPIGADT